MKRKNRSDRYQYVLLEISTSDNLLDNFTNDESISYRLNPFAYNEDLFDLEDKLKEKFWNIVNTKLTERQKEIIYLIAKERLTQQEIAKKLKINQSSITKSLHGNTDYSDKSCKRYYGGSELKIKKLAEEDPEIQSILNQIQELREQKF